MKQHERGQRALRMVFGLAIWSGVALAVTASPASQRLVQEGAALLERHQATAALEKFDQAMAADPTDAQAAFFTAAALNHLGRFDEALAHLNRGATSGSAHLEADFHRGWALMRLGEYEQAIIALTRYEQASPGRGQTSEFLGRCHLALGRLNEAQQHFEQAVARDPRLESTAALGLAEIAMRRGRAEQGAAHLNTAAGTEDGNPTSRALRLDLQSVTAAELTRPAMGAEKPWHLAMSFGGGYSSNVIGLPDTFALPADITNRSAPFMSFGFDGSYDVHRGERDVVTLGYVLESELYERSADTGDRVDQGWYVDYQHQCTDALTVGLTVGDSFLILDGDSFRNSIMVRPSLLYQVNDHLAAELAYAFTTSDYYFPTPAVSDRDNDAHSVQITGFLRVPETQLDLQAGYTFTTFDADGSDYDGDLHAVSLGAAHPLLCRIDGRIMWTHVFFESDNNQSFLGFAGRRSDDIDYLTVRLTRPIGAHATLYVQYDLTLANSTVPTFEYDQSVIGAGIVFSY